jgi:hypothetical protein
MVIQKSPGKTNIYRLELRYLLLLADRVCKMMDPIIGENRIACQWESIAILWLVSWDQTRVNRLQLKALVPKKGPF